MITANYMLKKFGPRIPKKIKDERLINAERKEHSAERQNKKFANSDLYSFYWDFRVFIAVNFVLSRITNY